MVHCLQSKNQSSSVRGPLARDVNSSPETASITYDGSQHSTGRLREMWSMCRRLIYLEFESIVLCKRGMEQWLKQSDDYVSRS